MKTDTEKHLFPDTKQISGKMWRADSIFRATTSLGILEILIGFCTDYGSIPKLAWSIIGCPHSGRATAGYYVHDALYGAQICTRAQADAILLDLMETYDVGFFKRHAVYRMVRMFGGAAWKSKTEYYQLTAKKYVRWAEVKTA